MANCAPELGLFAFSDQLEHAMDARQTERGTLADSVLAQARVPQAGTCCSLT
jgi:hypothetical protein